MADVPMITYNISGDTWQLCPKCNGSGHAPNSKNQIPSYLDVCDVCNGAKIISKLTGLPPNNTIK